MDIRPEIDRLLDKLENRLRGTGWERKDYSYFEYLSNSYGLTKQLPNSCFSVESVILNYSNRSEIWFKLTDKSLTFEGKNVLLSNVSPFKDEDYGGFDIFINPDYPKGQWENHTL